MTISDGGYIPADVNIAVGPNHVMQAVNAAISIYNKSGTRLQGPVPLRNLWAGLTGSACAANNGGDPVVVYDQIADRWLVTQMGSLASPYSQCVAVSKTSDPTGAYWLYSYSFGSNLNDYPKWSVWPTATNSAYLATYNLFANGASFVGAQICAYDRAAMIAGAASPASVCYTGISGASYLPADLDGRTRPPDGTPAPFVSLYGSSLGLYTIKPNFSVPSGTLSSFSTIGVNGYSQLGSIPQPGTTRLLDSLGDRLMNRLAFRVFGDHMAMVVNHSIVSGSSGGIRWYELRAGSVTSTPTYSLYQQGTYAPTSAYRWMGSAALDQVGNMALGYSASNATSLFPSILYTGRAPTDTLGTLGTESTLYTGSGSQTGYSRWGDYTSMRVDPSDDCTFWYSNEYYAASASYSWRTRIGSFKFSSCAATPDFALSASTTSLSFQRGSGGTSTVTASALNGYNSSISLSASCASGLTCGLSPTSVIVPGTSTLTLGSTTALAPGSYSIPVTGIDGAQTSHGVTVAATVTAPVTLQTPSPSALTLVRGAKTATNSTVTLNGDGGSAFSVSLSATGLPSGVTVTFSPSAIVSLVSSSSVTVGVKASSSAKRGTSTVTIRAIGGGNTVTKTLSVTVQ